MNSIAHVRIDYRLIHGQVITKWMKVTNADRILIIDDALASDSFLGMVYTMAAPSGVEVKILKVQDVVDHPEELQKGKILLLFKSVNTAVETILKGLEIEKLQIGGLENKAGRKIVHNQISMDMADYEKLKQIEDKGIQVYFQTVPEEEIGNLEKIYKKLS